MLLYWNTSSKRGNAMGEYYADYDEASACWGVFHTDKHPGFCYALFTTQEEAAEYAAALA